MRKLLLICISILLLSSCGDDKKSAEESVQVDVSYDYRKIPKKQVLPQEVIMILDGWEAFSDFSKSIDILYNATNNEDLTLAIEDLISKEKLLAVSKYPEEFDVPQVKSRQEVLRTFILKTKGDLDGNRNPTESMIQLSNAYNALRNQYIIIMNNRFELNSFLDEK
jgi:hypothetical protein